MYIIDDTYFKSPKREVPNLDEADSKSFAELELLIDEKCRLLLLSFLTSEQVSEFESYLADGIFPEDKTDIPQKWIDLVNGVIYTKNDIELRWNGLIYEKGTYKGSLLADYVYYYWLTENASYMTGVGESKGNPKGATSVNPTQKMTNTWNSFVEQYQVNLYGNSRHYGCGFFSPFEFNAATYPFHFPTNKEVSLLQFLHDHDSDYPNLYREVFEVKNQMGL
jgi:hypothetical protein